MKYIGDLITEVRRDTRNEDVPTSTELVGIQTNDFLRYANFGQERLQALILQVGSMLYRTQQDLSLTAGTQFYSVTDNLYLGEQIIDVKYSPSGEARDYYEIRERDVSYRNDQSGTPSFYFRQGSQIGLSPIPNSSSAKIRLTFDRALDRLDTRRGQISALTLSPTQLTALTLSTSNDDTDALGIAQHLCVNDVFGNPKMYNIPITGYNSTTGVVTLSGGAFTFGSGETAAVNDYITVGRYTTTHSKLNDLCEKYLALYCAYKIFKRDSSSDAEEAKEELQGIEQEITQSYAQMSRDEQGIQIDNEDLLLGGSLNYW